MKHKIVIIILILPLMVNLLVFNSMEFVASASTVRVTGITLNIDNLEFDNLGTTQRITPEVLPIGATNNRVTFNSDNDNVVTVNQFGDVTAVSNGITRVTVTTEDGGHSDSLLVIVNSFHVEKFQIIWEEETLDDEGNYFLLERDERNLTVKVYPFSNMLDNKPVIRMNNPGVLNAAPFEKIELEGNKAIFNTTISANRIGLTTLTVSVLEAATRQELHRNIPINVSHRPTDGLRFLFNGQTFGEGETLSTIMAEIPLQVNMPNTPGLEFSLTPFTEEAIEQIDAIAQICDENEILEFNAAGEVELFFRNSYADCKVIIRSTYRQIDLVELEKTLESIDPIEISHQQRTSIRFDMNPADFEEYFEIRWVSSSDVIRIERSTSTHVFVTALHPSPSERQWVVMQIFDENNVYIFSHEFTIGIINLGVDDIRFALNDDAGNPIVRGFEQTYVFGNKNYSGEDFVFETIIATSSTVPFASNALDFESNNESLLKIINQCDDSNFIIRITLRFTSNFEFGNTDRKNVTINARARYYDSNGERAVATYTFIIINAVNVSNLEEFNEANSNELDLVLRDNIAFTPTFNNPNRPTTPDTVRILGNLHGNGHTMQASEIVNYISSLNDIVFSFLNLRNFTEENTTLISNVVFAGFADDMEYIENDNRNPYSYLQSRGTLVTLGANTTLQYSQLLRAAILLYIRVEAEFQYLADDGGTLRVSNRNITVNNNLFSEAGTAGAFLGASTDRLFTKPMPAKNIVFGNLIFERTLMGVMFEPGACPYASRLLPTTDQNPHFSEFQFTLKEGSFLRFYNWIEEETMNDISLVVGNLAGLLSYFAFETKELDGRNFISIGIALPEAIIDAGTVVPELSGHFIIGFRTRLSFALPTLQMFGNFDHRLPSEIPGAMLPPTVQFLAPTFLDVRSLSRTTNGSHFDSRIMLGSSDYLGPFRVVSMLTKFTPGSNSDFHVRPLDAPNYDILNRQITVGATL